MTIRNSSMAFLAAIFSFFLASAALAQAACRLSIVGREHQRIDRTEKDIQLLRRQYLRSLAQRRLQDLLDTRRYSRRQEYSAFNHQ